MKSVHVFNCLRRTLWLAWPIWLLPVSNAFPQTAPTTIVWTFTDQLHSAREGHTASLLPDGRVLVAAGGNFQEALTATEIFDPTSETWSETAPSPTALGAPTATVLSDGRVLLAGGYTTAGWLKTCLIYDPAAGSWSATGDLNDARYAHTAELLPDGKVLVAGGEGGIGGVILESSEIYDPATGQWTLAGNLNMPRWYHASALLHDGRVMVAGGNDGPRLASVELYDSDSGTWTIAPKLSQPRLRPGLVTLRNGDVLAAGGAAAANGALKSSEVFYTRREKWFSTGGMMEGRAGTIPILLSSGEVVVVGGFYQMHEAYGVQEAEIFDPKTRAWSDGGEMNVGRFNRTATLLKDGRILAVGGEDYSLTRPLASCELGTLQTE